MDLKIQIDVMPYLQLQFNWNTQIKFVSWDTAWISFFVICIVSEKSWYISTYVNKNILKFHNIFRKLKQKIITYIKI